MNVKRISCCGAMLMAWLLLAGPAPAMDSSNVLVLYNADSPDSVAIAAHYAQVHPGVRQLAVTGAGTAEEVSYSVYLDTIRPQVLAALTSSTSCIVTTKGLPLRISNPQMGGYPYWSAYSSLESELTRIDTVNTRQLMGNQAYFMPGALGGNSLALNPYFNVDANFSYSQYHVRLTSRLDGFSAADVNAAVDRAQKAVIGRPGYTFLVDDDPNAPAGNVDKMPDLVNNVLTPRSIPVTYDSTTAFVRQAPGPVIGYVGHGTHGGAPGDYLSNPTTGLNVTPAAGAVFETYESFNAYTFNQNAIASMPTRQGLLAEWLHMGGTAGVGNVQEPGISSLNVTNEDRMIQMLLNGSTFAEAAWNATYQLSFVNTVVGDPLMRLRTWVPGDVDLDGDVDLFDISAVKAAYGTHVGDAGYSLMADMNANGAVDFWDLSYVKSHYTGSGGYLDNPIPEPTCVLLIAAGAVGLLQRRRQVRQ